MIGSAPKAGYPEHGSHEDPLLELKSSFLLPSETVAYHLHGSLAGTGGGVSLRVLKSRKPMTIVRRRDRAAAWSDVIVDRRRSATGLGCVKTPTCRSFEQL